MRIAFPSLWSALVMGSVAFACSGGGDAAATPSPQDPSPDPTPVPQTSGTLVYVNLNGTPVNINGPPIAPGPVPSWWSPVDVQGEAFVEPAQVCLAPDAWPRVTWENLTTGDAGGAQLSSRWDLACTYPFWAKIPVTAGSNTIRVRGEYYDGRLFEEDVYEVVRLAPGDPWPP